MNLRLWSTRRRSGTHVPEHEDVRWDLAAIALKGFLPQVALSCVCLTGATLLIAQFYGDRMLWRIAEVVMAVSVLRVGAIYGFLRESKKQKNRNYGLWAMTFGLLTVVFCAIMCLLNIYNFCLHDMAVQAFCMIGTYTLCIGISSRLSLVPRTVQFCIVMLQGSLAYMLVHSPNLLVRSATVLVVVSAVTSNIAIGNQYKVFIEQVRSRRRLKNLATHDSLTGLPNRHLFETTLDSLCALQKPFTVWMLDLDGFKAVNDTYGHAAGDELLRLVGRRLESSVRTGDLLARLGGDEFVILQPQVNTHEATRKMAERIKAEISIPYLIGGNWVAVGASIGIKISEHGEFDADQAMLAVDRALYHAKDFSRGGYEMV